MIVALTCYCYCYCCYCYCCYCQLLFEWAASALLPHPRRDGEALPPRLAPQAGAPAVAQRCGKRGARVTRCPT